jgi:hypothetical protein
MVPVAGANPVGFAVLGIRAALLRVTYLLLTACVISPLSRTNAPIRWYLGPLREISAVRRLMVEAQGLEPWAR